MDNKPIRPPPEGVIVGESIPRENERDEVEDSRLVEVENQLRARGEPYTGLSDQELRERARKLTQREGER